MRIDHVTVVWFVALVVAIILHEIAHGVVALWFGDDTAKRAGRLTLNPVPHIDLFGSIIIPAMAVLAGWAPIGWAKPVPVNPARLRHQRRDMLLVSLAGPGTNFALAFVSALIARSQFHGNAYTGTFVLQYRVLIPLLFAAVNLLLGVFNFLPIPPLDGAAIIERVLPRDSLASWYRFRQYGILILLLLLASGVLGRIINPVLDHLYRFVLR